MRYLILPALAAGLALGVPATHAGEAAKLAEQAEMQAAKGEHLAAIETMEKALRVIWNQSPLVVQRAVFVKQKAAGYGIFDPRAGNVFKPGEKIIVYVEPKGFRWKNVNDIFKSEMTADFELRTPDGKVLGGQKGFGRFDLTSRTENTEYLIHLYYNFTGLTPGKFIVGTTLHDKIGGSSVSFDLPFEVQQ